MVLFFDLDRTLWDFERNSRNALALLYQKYALDQFGVPSVDRFSEVYHVYNDQMWLAYEAGTLDRESLRWIRFFRTLEHFGIQNPSMSRQIAEEYIQVAPRQSLLIEGAQETLRILQERYTMHILTNGFGEAQQTKLEASGIRAYFGQLIHSDLQGFKKPDKRIFQLANEMTDTKPEACVMIGDDWHADIHGALAAGWRAIWYQDARNTGKTAPCPIVTQLIDLPQRLAQYSNGQ